MQVSTETGKNSHGLCKALSVNGNKSKWTLIHAFDGAFPPPTTMYLMLLLQREKTRDCNQNEIGLEHVPLIQFPSVKPIKNWGVFVQPLEPKLQTMKKRINQIRTGNCWSSLRKISGFFLFVYYCFMSLKYCVEGIDIDNSISILRVIP